MDHKQVEPGMVVLVRSKEYGLSLRDFSYHYDWVLVTAVHKGHKLALTSDPHIHGFYLSASPSGICMKGSGHHKLEDVIKAYYRKDCFSDDDELGTMGDGDILTLLHTGITPAGCHVNIYAAELEDKCLELTLEEIEQQYGCHVKIKGRRDD
jgi:hypothetical protein